MKQVEVILAELSPVLQSGFRSILEKHSRIQVIQEVVALSLLEEVLKAKPGCVAIVDWEVTPLEAVARLAKHSKLICYAMPESIEVRRHALQAGVRGFISNDQSPANIRRAVLTVGDGQIWLGKTSPESILGYQFSREMGHPRIDGHLTNREKQVIAAACRGLKSRGIALALHISEPTVAHHLTSIYAKLAVRDRVGLIIYAYQHSLHLADIVMPLHESSDSFLLPGA
jgi:DNA-binding NarL/FixJ family response regulator